MALIVWDSAYETEHTEIDAQHRGLVEFLNAAHMAITQGHAPTLQALEQLRVAMAAHFSAEEALMYQSAYPHMRQHKARHNQLLNDIDVLIRGSGLGRGIALEGSAFLSRWLMHHIGGEDRDLVRWIQQRGEANGFQNVG